MQSALRLIYPPRCVSCGDTVAQDFALCLPCWGQTPFAAGLVCDACGTPLPGQDSGQPEYCDACLTRPRAWTRGRAALVYADNARKLVLALKHGDRTDLARPAAVWLLRAARPVLMPGMLVVPVPLHRWRLVRRRYNQAALLSAGLARAAGLDHCPDLLIRPHATPILDGLGAEARFAALDGAIAVHPRRRDRLAGRGVLLVDDVMTSGATLEAAARACLAAGAVEVRIAVLARVAQNL
ncbi:double zinc ribbon domain-containing protein [Rhodovulum adriaticum]|uniref:Putative amidophosphoribosyltransferase n=1 Tax=Rhodovulum adriaticum TaxID=35804 RepID=A0A4R2P0S4_RHOAD|nr:double zinc ribbon domain-containing protein [Rhodovulum adriaticum]MBK1636121.1 amidophosphoribosyltransferase [Rhodovulum adriaticum]TCP27504.1 putative amidophosphoribosyltransferase [Rhodovulum adriaticum]